MNQLALRISTKEYPLAALLAIYFLSATRANDAQVLLGPLDQGSAVDSKVAAVFLAFFLA